MQEVKNNVESGVIPENFPVEKVIRDLGQAIMDLEFKLSRSMNKLVESDSGKPSRSDLYTLFSRLLGLIRAYSQIERCTMAHLQGMNGNLSLKFNSLIDALIETGVVTKERLKESTEKIVKKFEEDNKANLDDDLQTSIKDANSVSGS